MTTSYSVQRCLLKYSNFIVNYRSKKNIFKSKFWEIIRTCSSTKHSFQACFYCFKVWALWWTIHPAWFHESAITLVFAIILENFRAEGRFKSCPYTLDNVFVNVKRKKQMRLVVAVFFLLENRNLVMEINKADSKIRLACKNK